MQFSSDARDVFIELSFYFLTLCAPMGEAGKAADRGYKKEMRQRERKKSGKEGNGGGGERVEGREWMGREVVRRTQEHEGY